MKMPFKFKGIFDLNFPFISLFPFGIKYQDSAGIKQTKES